MDESSTSPPLEVWAGIECTVNRVGDRYFDQLVRSGHDGRETDMDLVAELGARAIRYPVLWERTAKPSTGELDFAWADRRLGALRSAGVEPVVGLLHHGSGPPFATLLDEGFAETFAAYAGDVARRYPWVERYTPVNEPLTTARFAALYGHWYPHRKDARSFGLALLAQCKATVLAMREIRRIVPQAELISTEDLASVQATPALAYQADHENERRWLSVDLLCGTVDRHHPLYEWIVGTGVDSDEVEWFLDNPCPPAIIGLNYYLTSERWLDEDKDKWPAWSHGGNGRDAYADVHAVLAGRTVGLEALLQQAWERFGLPLAITEAHLGGLRNEQMRWLVDVYDAASRARATGIDVRAVTAWAMFGSFDWCSLVTRDDGFYEPGLYDVRGPRPRPTALYGAVRDLARGVRPSHPALEGERFWARSAASCRAI